jgi:hypothetical protein
MPARAASRSCSSPGLGCRRRVTCAATHGSRCRSCLPTIRSRSAVEWIEGDDAWQIIDRLVAKYIDLQYPRDQERVVIAIEPDRQKVGMS